MVEWSWKTHHRHDSCHIGCIWKKTAVLVGWVLHITNYVDIRNMLRWYNLCLMQWSWKLPDTQTIQNQTTKRTKNWWSNKFLRQGWWWSAWVAAVKHMKTKSVTAAYIFPVQRESQNKFRDGKKTTQSASSSRWSYCSFYRDMERFQSISVAKKDPGCWTSNIKLSKQISPCPGWWWPNERVFLGYRFFCNHAAVLRCFWAMFISACPCQIWGGGQVGMIIRGKWSNRKWWMVKRHTDQ